MFLDIDTYCNDFITLIQKIEISTSKGEDNTWAEGFSSALTIIKQVLIANKKVIIIGNGGSASIASHLQNDLCKGSEIRAMVIHETSLLTALSNDIRYADAYPILVNLWGDSGDLLIAISSSGISENIVQSAMCAKKLNMHVITMSGFLPDNPLRRSGDVNFYIPSSDYGFVELIHGFIAHFLSDACKKKELV